MIYAYTRLRYQVSFYRTIGPLVLDCFGNSICTASQPHLPLSWHESSLAFNKLSLFTNVCNFQRNMALKQDLEKNLIAHHKLALHSEFMVLLGTNPTHI